MKHIYYSLILCIVIYSILTTNEKFDIKNYFKDLKGDFNSDENVGKAILGCLYGLTLLLFTLIKYIGLFTYNWWLFAILIIKDIIITLIRKKYTNFTLGVVGNIITVSFLIFAILNTYHFHIDVQLFN
jgi:hypothetical protein